MERLATSSVQRLRWTALHRMLPISDQKRSGTTNSNCPRFRSSIKLSASDSKGSPAHTNHLAATLASSTIRFNARDPRVSFLQRREKVQAPAESSSSAEAHN